MDPNTPIAEIGTRVVEALGRLFPLLAKNSILVFLGLALCTLGISLFVRARLLFKAGYLRRSKILKFHYGLMAMLVLLLILQACHNYGRFGTAFLILSLLFVLLSIFGLITFRKFGVAAAIISLWLTLPLREIPEIILLVQDYQNLSEFSIPGKLGIYTFDVMEAGRFLSLALIAAVLTVIVAAYYTKRRYLFRSSAALFKNAAICPKCGAPIVKAGHFCAYCGADISGRGVSELQWEPLEDDTCCTNCGKELNDLGICDFCGQSGYFNAVVKDVKKDAKNVLLKIGAIVLSVVLVFIPLLISDPLNYLTKGSAEITNTYIDKLNAWAEDPALAKDSTWLAEYDAASDALYECNGRCFTILPSRLNYTETYAYIQYLDASYYQMAVLEEMDEIVHTKGPEDFNGLGSYFMKTIDMQQQALTGSLKLILGDGNLLISVETIVLDTLRYWLSFVPMLVWIILLFALGGLALAGAVFLMLKAPDISPFKKLALNMDDSATRAAQEKERRAAAKKDRIITLIAVAIVVAFFVGDYLIESNIQKNKAPEWSFSSARDQGFTQTTVDLLPWLSECRTDPDAALLKKDEALKTIQASKEALDYLTERAIPEAESYTLDDVNVTKIAKELTPWLNKISAGLESGQLPNQETITETIRLLNEGTQYDQKLKAKEALEELSGLL